MAAAMQALKQLDVHIEDGEDQRKRLAACQENFSENIDVNLHNLVTSGH